MGGTLGLANPCLLLAPHPRTPALPPLGHLISWKPRLGRIHLMLCLQNARGPPQQTRSCCESAALPLFLAQIPCTLSSFFIDAHGATARDDFADSRVFSSESSLGRIRTLSSTIFSPLKQNRITSTAIRIWRSKKTLFQHPKKLKDIARHEKIQKWSAADFQKCSRRLSEKRTLQKCSRRLSGKQSCSCYFMRRILCTG